MADERAPREPRTLETRENDTRNESWEPASLLLSLIHISEPTRPY